jgi:hypothetical protein
MFTLEIDTSNSAFDDGGSACFEVARILRELAARLEHVKPDYGNLRDANGNKVGEWKLT